MISCRREYSVPGEEGIQGRAATVYLFTCSHVYLFTCSPTSVLDQCGGRDGSRSYTPLAGISGVGFSARGRATGVSSHPFSYGKGEFTAMAVNSPVSSHPLSSQRALRNERRLAGRRLAGRAEPQGLGKRGSAPPGGISRRARPASISWERRQFLRRSWRVRPSVRSRRDHPVPVWLRVSV